MTPNLSRRLAKALQQAQLPPAERARVVAAAEKATTFSDLPKKVQALIKNAEGEKGARPAKKWIPEQQDRAQGRRIAGGKE